MSEQLQEIQGIDLKQPEKIPFELFSKKTNKTTRLINNTESEFFIKGRNDWFKFNLTEPVFVTSVTVSASNYDYKNCEFRWRTPRKGAESETTVRHSDGQFTFEICDLITEFSFRPDQKYWGMSPRIESVSIEGFTLSWLDNARSQLSDLDGAKTRAIRAAQEVIDEAAEKSAKIQSQETKISEQERKIQENATSIEELEKELAQKKTARDKIQQDISDRKAEQSALQTHLEKQEATIEQRTAERERLGKEIDARTAELKSLESDIYLFPSELAEFTKRGGKDKAFYWKLALIPLIVITAIACQLLFNAVNLSTVFNEPDNTRVFSIFVTRLPYVVVATAIIAAMLKLAYALISEIMRIDKQTRSLAKISIVATDVSAASADNLSLTDEEEYHLRTALKMDLLREHLKTYLPDDFKYEESERIRSRLDFLKRQRAEKAHDSETTAED